jgi:methanogenic corrinoid protein MtbC1
LAERRKRFQEREQSERQKLIGKSVLMKASEDQLDTIMKRMKALGLDETIKRLA